MKKILAVSSLAIVMLVGCNTTGTDDETSMEERRTKVEQTRYNDGNSDNRNRGENNRRMTNDEDMNERNTNERYDVSQEAADAITREVPEVNSAYVITMGDKAYVAAMFDEDNDSDANRQNDNANRNNDPDTNGNNRNMNNEENRELNRTSDGMGDSGQLTDEIKKKISSVVRDQDDSIKDVYVTTNPEFSNLTSDYMDEVEAGNPLGGFFQQFGDMIERLFPQNTR